MDAYDIVEKTAALVADEKNQAALVASLVEKFRAATGDRFLVAGDDSDVAAFIIHSVEIVDEGDLMIAELRVSQRVYAREVESVVRSILDNYSVADLREAYHSGYMTTPEANADLNDYLDYSKLEGPFVEALADLTGFTVEELASLIQLDTDQDELDQVDEWDVRVVAEEYLDVAGHSPWEDNEEEDY